MKTNLRFGTSVLGFALSILIFTVGCSDDGPEIGTVSGKVTLDGKPLPQATVEFQPVDKDGGPSQGITDDEGNYTLNYRSGRQGALIGEHKVRVSTYQMISQTDGGGEIPELVPPKYNEQSELRKQVESGSNTIDLPLTSN